jgi:hypothetical protein
MHNKTITSRRILLVVILTLGLSSIFAQFGGGSGTEADPYQVATAEHLNNVRNYLTSYFIQTADIDLDVTPYNTGAGWVPIGGDNPNQFEGSFNGNGYLIANLYINRPATQTLWQGLFGKAYSAVFVNIRFTNVNITSFEMVGALVGECFSSNISKCSVDGVVSGYVFVGGLVSRGFTNNISNCYSSASVSGFDCVGGIIGSDNYGTISNCYATGSVTGVDNVGGLVGNDWEATTINCYSTGHVTGTGSFIGGLIGSQEACTSTNCYWNTQTSGQASSAGGLGRTTNDMTYPYAANTYVGWDFDTVWGADSTGTMNSGYPYLQTCFYLNTVDNPTYTPESGFYTEPISVVIQSATQDAEIFYTLDGSDPTEQSIQYIQPLNVISTVSVKARAFKSGMLPSEIVSAVYIMDVGTEDETEIHPVTELFPVSPNPFSLETSIQFKLTENSNVELGIYDLRGRLIRSVEDGYFSKGLHKIQWDGKDSNESHVPNGIYFIKAVMANNSHTIKIIKLR